MADVDLEDLLTRHKAEKKALTAQITALKKTVTKGEKNKRKEVLAEVDRLEAELKNRQEDELNEFNGRKQKSVDPSNVAEETKHERSNVDKEAVDAIQQLSLEEADSETNTKDNGPKKKRNRQKDRLVRLIQAYNTNDSCGGRQKWRNRDGRPSWKQRMHPTGIWKRK